MNENLKYTFSVVSDMLKFAETKNVALLTLIGAMIFGIIQSFNALPTWMHDTLKFIMLPLFFISMMICIYSFIPKLNSKKLLSDDTQKKGLKKYKKNKSQATLQMFLNDLNILYFGHIRFFKVNDLIAKFPANPPANLPENLPANIPVIPPANPPANPLVVPPVAQNNPLDINLAEQIIINSKIAWSKHILFRNAGWIFLMTVLIGTILILIEHCNGFSLPDYIYTHHSCHIC